MSPSPTADAGPAQQAHSARAASQIPAFFILSSSSCVLSSEQAVLTAYAETLLSQAGRPICFSVHSVSNFCTPLKRTHPRRQTRLGATCQFLPVLSVPIYVHPW